MPYQTQIIDRPQRRAAWPALAGEQDLRLPPTTPIGLAPQYLGASHVVALQRSAGNAAVAALLGGGQWSTASSSNREIAVQRCGAGPCDCEEGEAAAPGSPEPAQRIVMRKAADGEECETASDAGLLTDEDEETAAEPGEVAEEEEGGMGKTVQRFALKGFPVSEEAQMNTAIPVAEAKVKAAAPKKTGVIGAITSKTYEYHDEEDFKLCGWTFPWASYIKIGKKAFDASRCCDLASTIAHEASHTQWYTEGAAQKLECTCFGCSC
ncbi:MAG TPA: hypothetical protein VGQ64_08565 [Candidatus Limnocylindrales bacterium]|nr:hypothetical protein [Candidatus Limnocylindrales bacterium]